MGTGICRVGLNSKKAALPAMHIFVMQEEISVPRNKRVGTMDLAYKFQYSFLEITVLI
jgi:hypothetical protein